MEENIDKKLAENKEKVITGAAAAAGSALGAATVIGAEILMPNEAEAQTVDTVVETTEEEDAAAEQVQAEVAKPDPQPQQSVHAQHVNTHHTAHHVQEPEVEDPITDPEDIEVEPEVEVLEYTSVTADDGTNIDVAVISEDGEERAYYDINEDGYADLMVQDINNDQEISDNERFNVQDQHIEMQQYEDQYIAQNDPDQQGPDYINDGDVESYTA